MMHQVARAICRGGACPGRGHESWQLGRASPAPARQVAPARRTRARAQPWKGFVVHARGLNPVTDPGRPAPRHANAASPMLIFPIRHHSPAAALQVARLIRERRPRAVLIEGPADAEPLIPFLLDRETSPPVAVYAYRSGREPGDRQRRATGRSTLYPFCRYSPEYAALSRRARGRGRAALLRRARRRARSPGRRTSRTRTRRRRRRGRHRDRARRRGQPAASGPATRRSPSGWPSRPASTTSTPSGRPPSSRRPGGPASRSSSSLLTAFGSEARGTTRRGRRRPTTTCASGTWPRSPGRRSPAACPPTRWCSSAARPTPPAIERWVAEGVERPGVRRRPAPSTWR